MALSDLVLTLIVLTAEMTRLMTDFLHWHVSGILRSTFCYFGSLDSLLMSNKSLVWIAIDRFVAVVFPMKLGLISGRTRSIAIVSIWMCAGFFSCPLLIISKLVPSGSDIVCAGSDKYRIISLKQEFSYLGIYLVSVCFIDHFSFSCNNRSVHCDSNHLKTAEESSRGHPSKCATKCYEETKTSY